MEKIAANQRNFYEKDDVLIPFVWIIPFVKVSFVTTALVSGQPASNSWRIFYADTSRDKLGTLPRF